MIEDSKRRKTKSAKRKVFLRYLWEACLQNPSSSCEVSSGPLVSVCQCFPFSVRSENKGRVEGEMPLRYPCWKAVASTVPVPLALLFV